MVQKYDFPQETQLGNVGDPSLPQDAATKSYVDTRPADTVAYEVPGVYSNATVAQGNVLLSLAISAGTIGSVQVSAGTGSGSAMADLFNGLPLSQVFKFVGSTATFQEATVSLVNANTVQLNFNTPVAFTTLAPGAQLLLQSAAQTIQPFTRIISGANTTMSISTDQDAQQALTIAATGGGGGTPGGANTQVQFNNNGAFGGNAGLTWNGVQLGTNIISADASSSLSLRGATGIRVQDQQANFLGLNGALAGSTPSISATGSDTNVNLAIFAKGTGGIQIGTLANATPLIVADSAVQTALTPGLLNQVLTSGGPGKTPFWGVGGGGVSTAAIFTVGQAYTADNIGLVVRVTTNVPFINNASGEINTIGTGLGAISITSAWPPSTVGFNSLFVGISSSDNSTWGGVGRITTNPNGLELVAWIRLPPAGTTTFTNANIWQVANTISTVYSGLSLVDTQENRGSVTSLLMPELSFSYAPDNLGGIASTISTQPFIDGRIANQIGLTPLTYTSQGVISVSTGFGNAGTTWQAATVNYGAARNALATTGATPPVGSGNWVLPTYAIRISNIAAPSATQFATITQIQDNPTNSILVITFTGNQAYFANAGASSQTLFTQTGKFTFAVAPQQEIIRLANVNDVSSLNGLKQDVVLAPGVGIAIVNNSLTNQILVSNTGSGSNLSSNSTTYDSTQSQDNAMFAIQTNQGEVSNAILVGMPLRMATQFDQMSTGGDINAIYYVSSSNVVATQRGVNFPVSVSPFGDFRVACSFGAFQIDVTFVQNGSGDARLGDLAFTGCWFSKASLASGAANDPRINGNLHPLFDNLGGASNEGRQLSAQIPPYIISRDAQLAPSIFTATYRYTISASSWAGTGFSRNFVGSLQEYHPYIELDESNAMAYISAATFVSQSVSGQPTTGGFQLIIGIPGSSTNQSLQSVTAVGNTTNLPIIFQDAQVAPRSVSLSAASAITTSYSLRLPVSQATVAGQVLSNDGTGILSWASGAASNLQAVLNVGNSATNSVGNTGSILLADATTLKVTTIDGTRVKAQSLVLDGSTQGSLTIRAASTTTSYSLVLPAAQGAANQTLINDGTGILSWASGAALSDTLQQVLNTGNSATNTGTNISTILLTDSGTAKTTTIDGTRVESQALILDGSTQGTITLKANANTTSSYQLVLPASLSGAGRGLVSDSVGNLSWQFVLGSRQIRAISLTNITPSGAQVVDGITVVNNDTVGIFNQSDPATSGLYTVSLTNPWTRITSFIFQSVFAVAGTLNIGRTYSRSADGNIPGNELWVLTGVNTASGGSGTPGGLNTQFQYNNLGSFAGTDALTYDATNLRVSALAPIVASNIARLADVQAATAGLIPRNVPGILVHISEVNIVGVYTNNTGQGSATYVGSGQLSISGAIPLIGQEILMVAQVSGLQNGSYLVVSNSAAGFSLIRTNIPEQFANFWVATNQSSQNYGVQYSCVTLNIVVGTTAIVYALFGVPNSTGTATLQQITTAGNTTTTPISIGGVILAGWSAGNTTNTIALQGSPTGGTPSISVTGIDLNSNLNLAASGSGAVFIATNSSNFLKIAGGSTQQGPTISAAGGANASLNLAGVGTGVLNLATNFSAGIQVIGSNLTTVSPQITADGPAGTGLNLATEGGTLQLSAPLVSVGTSLTNALTLSNNQISKVGAGVLSITSGTGALSYIVLNNSDNVAGNGIGFLGSPSNGVPAITVIGDANGSIALNPSGNGTIQLGSSKQNYIRITPASINFSPQIAAVGDTNATLTLSASGTLGAVNIGNSAPNFIRIVGSAAGVIPVIAVSGETNLGLQIQTNGSGVLTLGNTAWAAITVGGNTDTSFAQIAAQNNLTNCNLAMAPKGNGSFYPIGATGLTASYQPKIAVASSAGASTLGFGSSGQVMMSNGALSPYWGDIARAATASTFNSTTGLAFNTNFAIAGGVETTVNWNTGIANPPTGWTYGAGVITNSTGSARVVAMSVSVQLLNGVAGLTEHDVWFSLNNTTRLAQAVNLNSYPSGPVPPLSVSTIALLNPGDNIKVVFWANANISLSAAGAGYGFGGSRCFFSVIG